MLFGRRIGCGGGWSKAWVVAACVFAGPWAGRAWAESSDAVVQRVRNVLRQHSLKKVLLAVREDGQNQADDEAKADMAALERRLEMICRQVGIEPVDVSADGDLDGFSLTRLPALDDVEKALTKNKADAVLAVSWKVTKSGVILRVTLLDDDKVLWNNRATLTRAPAKSQAASKMKTGSGSSAVAAKGSSAYGGSNLAGASMLGSGYSIAGLGRGLAGGNGIGLGGGTLATLNGSTTNGEIPILNTRILEFAISNLGKQVGNGECWTLAAEALKYAGAKPPNMYDFGTDVPLDKLLPGDILHFENAVFITPTSWTMMGNPDHVAIVGEISGNVLKIYHQNVNGDKRDQIGTIDLATHDSGNITGYRADPASGSGSGPGKDCKKEKAKEQELGEGDGEETLAKKGRR